MLNDILNYILSLDIALETVVMGVCVLLGASILTQFTRVGGLAGFAINSMLLLGGALAADYLTHGMPLPLYFIQRILLVYFGGMLVSALLLLLLFPRPRGE